MMSLKDNYKFIILGATGFLGKRLFSALTEDGYDCIGTTRKVVNEGSYIYYDIEKEPIEGVLKHKSRTKKNVAIFCIAASNIKWCEDNKDKAYEINVNKTATAIESLIKSGFKVIWFSSDNVFDGKKGEYLEEDVTSPINVYGKTKEKMEKYLLENLPSVCILRLSKVVDEIFDEKNVFTEWQKQVDDGKIIRCVRGNRLSFVSIEQIYDTILTASRNDLRGLYNCGGIESYSRYELACEFLKQYSPEYNRITECDIDDFKFVGERPLDISMNSSSILQMLDFEPKCMREVIREYLSGGRCNG